MEIQFEKADFEFVQDRVNSINGLSAESKQEVILQLKEFDDYF